MAIAAVKASPVKEEPHVIKIEDKSEFYRLIAETLNKHILVEFSATWCGPCRLISPRLEELASEYSDKLLILKIDVDDLEELAEEHDITSMPTFMIYKNKVKLEQFVGSNSEKVESTLEKFCGKPEVDKKASIPVVKKLPPLPKPKAPAAAEPPAKAAPQ